MDPDLYDESGATSRALATALFPAGVLSPLAPGPPQVARPPTTPVVTRPEVPSTPRTSDAPVRTKTNSFGGTKLQIYVLTAQAVGQLRPGEGFESFGNKGDQFSYKNIKTTVGKTVVPLPGVYIQHPTKDGVLFKALHFPLEFADRVEAESLGDGLSFDDWVALRRHLVNTTGGGAAELGKHLRSRTSLALPQDRLPCIMPSKVSSRRPSSPLWA